MSPIYSEKQIVVRDYAHPEYQTHPQVFVHAGQGGGIHPTQNQYSARSTDDLLRTSDSLLSKGMDFNIIFGQPLTAQRSATSELRSTEDYDKNIEDLRQRLEHLESLRQNVANMEDSSEPTEQHNFV
ncbi:hypothetical protein O3M35_006407 [Rhynocoris fuscipes]|uniref:Uncharacterized protein n=1 Tax=Rhynocoris fuscipes TaxID=488301 RepID=A0AAW1DEZ7_9HEMI